jgi:hypothetical protein
VVEKDDLPSPQFVATGGKCRNETATFALDGKLAKIKTLAVWLTQMRADSTPVIEYERQADITVGPGGEFSLVLPVNALLTITSLTASGKKGSYPTPPPAVAFPLPHTDNFDSYTEAGSSSRIARYFADMSGGFAVIPDPTGKAGAGGVLQQQTPQIPIGWYGNQRGDRSPYTSAATVASLLAAILAEIYLCNVCSCHAILRRNGRGVSHRWLRHGELHRSRGHPSATSASDGPRLGRGPDRGRPRVRWPESDLLQPLGALRGAVTPCWRVGAAAAPAVEGHRQPHSSAVRLSGHWHTRPALL